MTTLLGELSPRQFLQRHWQKRPLLVRGAIPDFLDPISPDELAGLACEPDVESRLVQERGGARPWQVVHGPQDPRRLRRLPRSHWTLLVAAVERHVSALAALQERFDFVPRWRRDDVMVSLAADRGSVGPHIDSYDVFLLQGAGERHWRIDTRASEAYREGLELRVLKRFHCEQEWVLRRGDMLYVPPGVAHWGVARGVSLTYSIGFRAPSQRDLLLAYLQRVLEATPATLYADPDLRVAREPGRISERALQRLNKMVAAACRLPPRAFARLMGEQLTQRGDVREPARAVSPARLCSALARPGAMLVRDPASRIGYTGRGAETVLHVDGCSYPLGARLAHVAPLLCGPSVVPLGQRPPSGALLALLVKLVSAGAFAVQQAREAPATSARNRRGSRS